MSAALVNKIITLNKTYPDGASFGGRFADAQLGLLEGDYVWSKVMDKNNRETGEIRLSFVPYKAIGKPGQVDIRIRDKYEADRYNWEFRPNVFLTNTWTLSAEQEKAFQEQQAKQGERK